MVKNLAKKAMTTAGQKACYVIDHLVEALGNEPSSSLRRAMILVDIDQYPGTTQTGILERLQIHKSSLNREIEWLFNYGCIMRQGSEDDARSIKLMTCGYSKKALEAALDYYSGEHRNLMIFLTEVSKVLKQEKPTLRDAKLAATIYVRKRATRQELIDNLYKGSPTTDHRALNELISAGVIEDVG